MIDYKLGEEKNASVINLIFILIGLFSCFSITFIKNIFIFKEFQNLQFMHKFKYIPKY